LSRQTPIFSSDPPPPPLPHSQFRKGEGVAPEGSAVPPDAPRGPDPGFPQISGYDIIDRVGRGAMGVVYEAIQQSTGRRVAVKILQGSGAGGAARRFEREVDLMSRLSHPGIVSVIDSGLHKDEFYFVMEFVDGVTLDEYAPPGRHAVPDTVRLVAEVAEAVDYAHQRGVLHRDLKPSNVLVDERRHARLVDFGLGRAIDSSSGVLGAAAFASVSQPGQMVGTLAFMAPEQAMARMEQVGLRSDVYALGAILYYLLTGSLASDISGPLHRVVKGIAEIDPVTPSVHRRGLGRDLDAVVLKALEKSPQKRYATAGELAADLRRVIAGEAVTARRVGALVRGARWLRRRPAVAIPALLLIVLGITFAGVLRSQQLDAAKARRELGSIMGQAWEVLARQVSPGKALANEAVAARLTALADAVWTNVAPAEPQEAAQDLQRIGQALVELRQPEAAISVLERARDLSIRTVGPDHALTARALHSLASATFNAGRASEGRDLYLQALKVRQKGSNPLETAETLQYLGVVYRRLNEFESAEECTMRALTMRLRELAARGTGRPEVDADVRDMLINLGTLDLERAKFDQAELDYQTALAVFDAGAGAGVDLDRGRILHSLGVATLRRAQRDADLGQSVADRYALARERLAEARRLKWRAYRGDSPDVADTITAQSEVEQCAGNLDEALRFAEEAVAIRLRTQGETHSSTADALMTLARVRLARGELPGAQDAAERCIAIREQSRTAPSGELFLAEARGELGAILIAQGCPELGRPMLEAALDRSFRERGPDDRRTLLTLHRLMRGARPDAPGVPPASPTH